MEYYKNYDLNDIVYFCEYDLIWKTEIWKDVVNYYGIYKISNLSRVKSLKRTVFRKGHCAIIKERILKQGLGENYLVVTLSKDSVAITRTVHQLVAETFLNHVPCGLEWVIDHIDNNKVNNQVYNLRIITQRENKSDKNEKYTSQYTGVSWVKRNSKWKADIRLNGKRISLGLFDNEYDAHIYYENAIISIKKGEEIIIKKHMFSSMHKGVDWNKQSKKWRSRIYIDGKLKHLGTFINEIDAYNAYQYALKNINIMSKN